MSMETIITLVSTLVPSIAAIISFIIALIKKIKAVKNAKSVDEIKELAQSFVVEAEALYKDIDAIVKQQGKTCGAMKKDSVMTKVQDACLGRKIAFDKEFWSKVIDDLVTVTRQVNAKQ